MIHETYVLLPLQRLQLSGQPRGLFAGLCRLLAGVIAFGLRLPGFLRRRSAHLQRMGRLAVDQAFKGQGPGGALLADALDRTARSEIAAFALMVDAKDEAAAAFYRHHGFMALPDSPLILFLPPATVQRS